MLAIDEYAGVGWAGVLLPLGADYRPLPVTLGWLALYGGLAAGLTARFAGRLGRVWWPVHRVAIVIYAAAWLHGVLSGTDSAALGLLLRRLTADRAVDCGQSLSHRSDPKDFRWCPMTIFPAPVPVTAEGMAQGAGASTRVQHRKRSRK